jgi:hypothetical protein
MRRLMISTPWLTGSVIVALTADLLCLGLHGLFQISLLLAAGIGLSVGIPLGLVTARLLQGRLRVLLPDPFDRDRHRLDMLVMAGPWRLLPCCVLTALILLLLPVLLAAESGLFSQQFTALAGLLLLIGPGLGPLHNWVHRRRESPQPWCDSELRFAAFVFLGCSGMFIGTGCFIAALAGLDPYSSLPVWVLPLFLLMGLGVGQLLAWPAARMVTAALRLDDRPLLHALGLLNLSATGRLSLGLLSGGAPSLFVLLGNQALTLIFARSPLIPDPLMTQWLSGTGRAFPLAAAFGLYLVLPAMIGGALTALCMLRPMKPGG